MTDRERLEKKLTSSSVEERREATVDLGREGSPALPLLFRAMADPDWRVRKTAVEAILSVGGERVVAGLIQALSAQDNAGMRNSAVEALIRIGSPAVDVLLPELVTSDADVRKFIVDILGDIRDVRAVPDLIRMLDDADDNISVASAEALGKLRDPRAVDALLLCLSRTDPVWRDYAAAEALGEIGDERALQPLLAALNRSGLREPILSSLGKIGNANTLAPLLAGLSDPLRIVREVSVMALAAIAHKSEPLEQEAVAHAVRTGMNDTAVGLLEEMLASSSGELLEASITLVGWTGRAGSIRTLLLLLTEEELEDPVAKSLRYLDRSEAAALIGWLANENALIRRTVARILGEAGCREAEAPLINLLNDENGHVRSSAAIALGHLRSRAAIAPLIGLLADEYESVQETAILALAEIGDDSMLDGLIKDFSARDAHQRKNISLLLGKFASEKAVAALAFALKDEEPNVRKAVVLALKGVPAGKSLKSLLLAITDDDPEVRILAVEALSVLAAPEAFSALVPLLEDNDLWVRAAAARGLGRTGGEQAGTILMAHLESAADIFLLALVESLGRIAFKGAREALLGLADHPDPEVRKTVLSALAGYTGEAVQKAVRNRLADPHWSVRKAAIDVLMKKRDAAAESLLDTMARSDPDASVRQTAKEALRK
jgi:HEAT repeat protein